LFVGIQTKAKARIQISPLEFYNQLNQRILKEIETDGRIFLAGTQVNEKTAMRICCVNHRRTYEDIDYLFDVLREIGEKTLASL
jgi:aromatic-L-amino-acid/L-tryptophan decarboxylase